MSHGMSRRGGIAPSMIGADRTSASTRAASRSHLVSSRIAIAIFAVALALLGVMCGGTTGQEGLQLGSGSDAAAPGEAAGPDMDSGAFDVIIDYTTRALPDVVAPPDTGA